MGTRSKVGYMIWVVGAERTVLRDAYHSFLRIRWSASLALIGLAFMAVNVVFASVYEVVGGVDGLHQGSFFDALVFSVQTLGTIGYGVMHPESHGANIAMIVEAITGIIFTAVVTGLVFAKFSRTTGRIAFSDHCVVCTHEGVPTLMFRVGNQRSNTIVEATLHVVASYTHTTKEGSPFYKLIDLPLTRNRMGGMRRGWLVMHPIDEASPFHGITAEDAKRMEIELEISLLGFDDVTLQTVHAMHHYGDMHIKFGQRFADSLTMLANGDMLLDMTKFHATVPE